MVTFSRHTYTAQAAYQDLVTSLLDETVSEIRGTPTARIRGARSYWYDRYRVGTAVHERYLGEDSESLRGRIERHDALKEGQRDRRAERSRLVRLLRGERYLGMDGATGSLMHALARIGVFRLGGVLVGTRAFRIYEGEMGLKLKLDHVAMTNDIDIASFERLSLALDDKVAPSVANVLERLHFAPLPSLEKGKVWRWRQTGTETSLGFLTPSFSDREELRELPALGVAAQSLHFLNYLIAEPIAAAAVYRDGVLVQVPRPERFAIHKLIVADRRRAGAAPLKAQKDLMQSELLLAILVEDRPGDVREAYEDGLSRGPQWRRHIEASLARAPGLAELLERAL